MLLSYCGNSNSHKKSTKNMYSNCLVWSNKVIQEQVCQCELLSSNNNQTRQVIHVGNDWWEDYKKVSYDHLVTAAVLHVLHEFCAHRRHTTLRANSLQFIIAQSLKVYIRMGLSLSLRVKNADVLWTEVLHISM